MDLIRQKKIKLYKEKDRLKTFENNWLNRPISANILAALGFYYVGPEDFVKCYFCEQVIGFWNELDNVAFEHYKFSRKCPFLANHKITNNKPIDVNIVEILLSKNILSKNIGFDVCGFGYPSSVFDEINNDFGFDMPIPPPLPPKKRELCKICFINKFNSVYIPCGHIVACATCAIKTAACPICRKQYHFINPIFFS